MAHAKGVAPDIVHIRTRHAKPPTRCLTSTDLRCFSHFAIFREGVRHVANSPEWQCYSWHDLDPDIERDQFVKDTAKINSAEQRL
jgi:hypothetical protein